ncbi:MAG: hypothetical protein WAV51_00170 [Microgenomates group bacterium]
MKTIQTIQAVHPLQTMVDVSKLVQQTTDLFLLSCYLNEILELISDVKKFRKQHAGLPVFPLFTNIIDPETLVLFKRSVEDRKQWIFMNKTDDSGRTFTSEEAKQIHLLCTEIIEKIDSLLGTFFILRNACNGYFAGQLVRLKYYTGQIASVTPMFPHQDAWGFSLNKDLLQPYEDSLKKMN